MSATEIAWLAVGFGGQIAFTCRFLVQWLVSEKRGVSTVPTAFWWFSIVGGAMLLAYAVYRRDPVIITGQLFGLIVYGRNLMLIARSETNDQAAPVAAIPPTIPMPDETGKGLAA